LLHIFLKYGSCDKHFPENHVFQEHKFGKSRLYYKHHTPVLELNETRPWKNGEAHGYLLGSNIYQFRKNLDCVLFFMPPADKIPNVITKIREQIPVQYMEELAGMVSGYNRWIEDNNKNTKSKIQIDDFIKMHLLPDSKHFYLYYMEQKLAISNSKQVIVNKFYSVCNGILEKMSPACTTILAQIIGLEEKKKKISDATAIMGRNMDWLPFGIAGTQSLVVVWSQSGVASFGFPGLIGCISGWNRNGLCLAMNVCPGKTSSVRGIPSVFLNRLILENDHHHSSFGVEDACLFIENNRPLGPYHLSLIDIRGNGKCISFYQDENNKDFIRDLQLPQREQGPEESNNHPNKNKIKIMTVLNWRYPKEKGGSFNSEKRDQLLKKYFNRDTTTQISTKQDLCDLVKNALTLRPYINSWISVHSLFFDPQNDKVMLKMDNGYAPSSNGEEFSMGSFFVSGSERSPSR
jgi:hypothetical protein